MGFGDIVSGMWSAILQTLDNSGLHNLRIAAYRLELKKELTLKATVLQTHSY